jgi:hypothetical protein
LLEGFDVLWREPDGAPLLTPTNVDVPDAAVAHVGTQRPLAHAERNGSFGERQQSSRILNGFPDRPKGAVWWFAANHEAVEDDRVFHRHEALVGISSKT